MNIDRTQGKPRPSSSPVVQASEDSIDLLRAAATTWGNAIAEAGDRSRFATHAEVLAATFNAFGVAFGALPRFRTEPALRRFMEALQQLERALKDVNIPAFEPQVSEAATQASQAAHHAEAAFAALSGKPAESLATARTVRGSVQRLLTDRGYGFLRQDGETTEVFFSAQGMRAGRIGDLKVGQAVSFRVAPDPRVPGRLHAVDVQPLR
jgi:cold shock CspA family protein